MCTKPEELTPAQRLHALREKTDENTKERVRNFCHGLSARIVNAAEENIKSGYCRNGTASYKVRQFSSGRSVYDEEANEQFFCDIYKNRELLKTARDEFTSILGGEVTVTLQHDWINIVFQFAPEKA